MSDLKRKLEDDLAAILKRTGGSKPSKSVEEAMSRALGFEYEVEEEYDGELFDGDDQWL